MPITLHALSQRRNRKIVQSISNTDCSSGLPLDLEVEGEATTHRSYIARMINQYITTRIYSIRKTLSF